MSTTAIMAVIDAANIRSVTSMGSEIRPWLNATAFER